MCNVGVVLLQKNGKLREEWQWFEMFWFSITCRYGCRDSQSLLHESGIRSIWGLSFWRGACTS